MPHSAHVELSHVALATAVLYLGGAVALGPSALVSEPRVLAPLLVLVCVAAVAHHRSEQAPGPFAALAPIAMWPLLYDGFVQVASLRPDRFIDRALAHADATLFHRLPGPPSWPLGGGMEEVANLFYASFYFVIPGAMLAIWRARGTEAAARYSLSVLVAQALCGALWLLFPAGGYHLSGSPLSAAAGPSTALVRAIYAANPHYAAAFPSSHVALATVAALMLVWNDGSRAWPLWSLGIAFATIYGQYHYAVDAPPAVLVAVAAVTFVLRDQLPQLAADRLQRTATT